jgi:hypothetical protein
MEIQVKKIKNNTYFCKNKILIAVIPHSMLHGELVIPPELARIISPLLIFGEIMQASSGGNY